MNYQGWNVGMNDKLIMIELLKAITDMFQFNVWHCNGMIEAEHLKKIGDRLIKLNNKFGIDTFLNHLNEDEEE